MPQVAFVIINFEGGIIFGDVNNAQLFIFYCIGSYVFGAGVKLSI